MTYADLLPGRRLMAEAYTSQPTQPAQPALTGQVLAAALTAPSARCDILAALHAGLVDLTEEVPAVPDLGDTGRHYPHTVQRVADDWSPLSARVRQEMAPTYYATRILPGQDGMTGRIPVITGEA